MEITSDLEAPSLAQESDEDRINAEQRSVIWWIMLFVLLFQTLHVIPERAIAWLLRFFGALLKYFGKYSNFIQGVALAFPTSVYLMKKYMDKHGSWKKLHKYVVCPKCHSLYTFEETYEKRGGQFIIKTCQHKDEIGRTCHKPLLRRIVTHNKKPLVYPHLIYPYNDVIHTLGILFGQKGFYEKCESLRTEGSTDTDMTDVFHGQMWKDLRDDNGMNFLSQKNHYGLFLNVDWYKPYKNQKYSIGVIYMVILYLPREVRYKRENVILVGLIPGPTEPPLTINSYITPLVFELLKLWNGIQVSVGEEKLQTIWCALVGVGCDLPAGRKLCGFLSYSANLGCSCCYKTFSQGFGC